MINAIGSDSNAIEKTISFKVVTEKLLLVELSEQNILAGKNFTVKVTDETLKGMTNALVKILDKEGKAVKSISGDGADGKGKSGLYRVTNDLPVGLYEAEVSVPGYATRKVPFLITTQNVLSFTDSIEAKIMLGQKATAVNETLTNNSEFTISNLTSETSASENFKVTAFVAPAMGKNQKQSIQINVAYVGDTNDTADESINFTIRGFVENKFMTSISATIHATYNKKLEQSCLKMEPSSLTINLLGTQGITDSDTVEVTNNCEQDILLKARVKEKTKKSYVLVTSEDIMLGQGETKNLTITATNMIDRQLLQNTTYSYEITYDSNALTKRMTVTVKLINPSIALSYPGQITLWLAQSSATAKATAAQPLFVTNMSEFPVENINFSVDTQYGTGGNVKITVEPSGAVNLEKRQSIAPPKVVFAQASTKISEPVEAQILIKGKLGNLNNSSGQRDNYNYYDDYSTGKKPIASYNPKSTNYSTGSDILGVVKVIVYYSGYECLKVFPVDAMEFHLSSEGAQIVRRIGIQNNCAEPVRVTGGKSQSREMMIGLPQVIIPVNQQVNLPMTVVSFRENLTLKNYPITITGLTEISQTPIESKTININVYAGEDFSAQYTKSVQIEAKVCGQEAKEKIGLPKTGTDCTNSYCDAKAAGKYIAGKIDALIKRAESKAYSKTDQAETFGCESQGYCTFSQLGIQLDTLDMFLQNDVLSAEVLAENMSSKGASNSGFKGGLTEGDFRFVSEAIDETFLGIIARSGYGKQVFVDRAIEGCGFYKISIDGAFNASGGRIVFEAPIITVRALPMGDGSKIVTKECSESIANITNFTPIDEGYTVSDSKGTWLTSVEASGVLKEIGSEIAKTQFKSAERLSTSGQGNIVKVIEAPLVDALAELCISGGSGTKVATLKVGSQIKDMKDADRDAYSKQVAKMAVNAINGTFGENCLVKSGSNFSCIRLTDTSDLSTLKLTIGKTLQLLPTYGCVEGTVTSGVYENIKFNVDPFTEGDSKFLAIKAITVEDTTAPVAITKDRKYIYREEFDYIDGKPVGKVIINNNMTLSYTASGKDKQYSKKIKVCVEPGTDNLPDHAQSAFYAANGSIFVVKAISILAATSKGTPDEDGKVTISTGTIHPNDLIAMLTVPTNKSELKGRGENEPYYFTVTWKGTPNETNLKDYFKGLSDLGLAPDGVVQLEGKGYDMSEKTQNVFAEARKSAMYSYLTTCIIATSACNLMTGATGVATGALSALFDCGIPATFAVSSEGDLPGVLETAKNWFTKNVVNRVMGTTTSPEDKMNSWMPSYTKTSALGSGVGLATRGVIASGRLYNSLNNGNIQWSTDQMKETYEKAAKKVLTDTIPNAGTDPAIAAKVEAAAKKYGAYAAEQYKESLQATYKAGLKRTTGQIIAYDYATIKGDLMIKAVQDADASVLKSKGLMEFLTSPASGTTGTSMLEDLTATATSPGVKPTSAQGSVLLTKVNTSQTAIANAIASADPLTSILESSTRKVESLADSLVQYDDVTTYSPNPANPAGPPIAKTIKVPRPALRPDVETLAESWVNDITKGKVPLGAPEKRALVTKITDEIMGGAGVTQLANPSKNAITIRLENATKNALADPTYAYLTKLPNDSIDGVIGKALNDEIIKEAKKTGDKIDDVVKNRGSLTKIKDLFKSPRFYAELGRGLACGTIANMAGVYAYDYKYGVDVKKAESNSTTFKDVTLTKNHTYKMTLALDESNGKFDPTMTDIDTEEETNAMIIAMNQNTKGVKGTWLKWNEKLSQKNPEERTLSMLATTSNLNDLRINLGKTDYYSGNPELLKEVMKRVQSSSTQSIIYNYASDKSKSNKDLKDGGALVKNQIKARESLVGALVVADWDATKVTNEANEPAKNTYYKDKILLMLDEMSKNNGKMSEAIAKKVIGNDFKANDFITIFGEWDNLAK